MTDRSTGEGENKREYTNNQCKRERNAVRPNHAMKVCMHNPAKLELQQERKRFLPSQRAACCSERMEEQMTDRSMGEGENRSEYTNKQCKRERKPVRPNHAMKVCMHNPAKLELQQERRRFLPSQRAACRSEQMEDQMTDPSMGEGEKWSEYRNKQCKGEQKPVRPDHAMKVCMHNPAKLELQQERKRFLPSQGAACHSEEMEEQMNDRSMGQRECKRVRTPLRPNQATSSNGKKAIEGLNTRVTDLLQ